MDKKQKITTTESVSVTIVGDFCPINEIEKTVLTTQKGKHTGVLTEFTHKVASADFRIANLECPLTTSETKILKSGPCLKAHPQSAKLLKEAEFDLITLANNHIYDFGPTGLKDTINVCEEIDVPFVGAGLSKKEAAKPHYATIRNKRLTIINFCENEFGCASEENGGANHADLIDNIKVIKEAQIHSDFIILIIHGGHEYWEYPSPRMVKHYRFYAEQGVDLIIGHHTHVVSGYEVHNNVPIFYSIGNFLFPGVNKSKSWYQGIAISATFHTDKETCDFKILPFNQDEKGVHLMSGQTSHRYLQRIKEISDCIKDSHCLENKWKLLIAKKTGYWQNTLLPLNKRFLNLCRRLTILEFFINRNKVLRQMNAIRCESLREIIIGQLEAYQTSINDDSDNP